MLRDRTAPMKASRTERREPRTAHPQSGGPARPATRAPANRDHAGTTRGVRTLCAFAPDPIHARARSQSGAKAHRDAARGGGRVATRRGVWFEAPGPAGMAPQRRPRGATRCTHPLSKSGRGGPGKTSVLTGTGLAAEIDTTLPAPAVRARSNPVAKQRSV